MITLCLRNNECLCQILGKLDLIKLDSISIA